MYQTSLKLLGPWELNIPVVSERTILGNRITPRYPPDIGHWYVDGGDYVKRGEPICQIISGAINGPKGPDLISPLEGRVISKAKKGYRGLSEYCEKTLITIETTLQYSAQELCSLKDELIFLVKEEIRSPSKKRFGLF